jgi:hypothetical protein
MKYYKEQRKMNQKGEKVEEGKIKQGKPQVFYPFFAFCSFNDREAVYPAVFSYRCAFSFVRFVVKFSPRPCWSCG